MSMTTAFTRFANAVSRYTGRPLTFIVCIALVIIWAVSGPAFKFSDTWQLVINTSTTIITFLMVFLIQNTQNRDNAAIQAKLDELIRVTNAKNGFIGIEKLTDKELEGILEDFEGDCETPLGEKSRIIDERAALVKAHNSKLEDDLEKAKGRSEKRATVRSAAKPAAQPTAKPAARKAAARKRARS